MDLLDRLLDHDQWATSQLLDRSRALTDEQLDREFDIGHRTLRATLAHMVHNVGFWTGVMTGQRFAAAPGDLSLAALIDRNASVHATFAAFARTVRDEQRLDDIFVDHFDEPQTYAGAILHVILHDAEHRTEALHILSRLGVPDLPEVDHALWDHVRRGAFRADP